MYEFDPVDITGEVALHHRMDSRPPDLSTPRALLRAEARSCSAELLGLCLEPLRSMQRKLARGDGAAYVVAWAKRCADAARAMDLPDGDPDSLRAYRALDTNWCEQTSTVLSLLSRHERDLGLALEVFASVARECGQ